MSTHGIVFKDISIHFPYQGHLACVCVLPLQPSRSPDAVPSISLSPTSACSSRAALHRAPGADPDPAVCSLPSPRPPGPGQRPRAGRGTGPRSLAGASGSHGHKEGIRNELWTWCLWLTPPLQRLSFHLQKLGARRYPAVGSGQNLSFDLSRQSSVPERVWTPALPPGPAQALLQVYNLKVWWAHCKGNTLLNFAWKLC